MKQKFFLLISLIMLLAFVLRFLNISLLPPYWEEAAIGYDAFSILKTARDHHGNLLPLTAFESFGDWKPALYFYAVVPFLALFDLSVLAVRLPSILAGVSIVLAVALISKKMGQSGIVAALLAAILPWSLLLSRTGFETHLATAFVTWGIYFGLSAIDLLSKIENKTKTRSIQIKFALTAIFLVASMYTYHATRISAPLFGLMIFASAFLTINKSNLTTKKNNLKKSLASTFKYFSFAIIFAFIFAIPIILSLLSPAGIKRAQETNLLATLPIAAESNEQRSLGNYSLVSRAFSHRFYLQGMALSESYLSHFSPKFLFLSGDSNPRHSTQFFGQLYHLDAVFVLLGLFALFAVRHKYRWLLSFWLLIAVIPASFTTGTPHALRISAAYPAYALLTAFGIEMLYAFIQKRLNTKIACAALALFFLIYSTEFLFFWREYMYVYPTLYSQEWQVGYKELYEDLSKFAKPSESISVTRSKGRPAMYLWFYSKTNPKEVQEINDQVQKDQGEFLSFQNYTFYTSQADIPLIPGLVAVGWDELGPFLQRAEDSNVEITPLQIIKANDYSNQWAIARIEE